MEDYSLAPTTKIDGSDDLEPMPSIDTKVIPTRGAKRLRHLEEHKDLRGAENVNRAEPAAKKELSDGGLFNIDSFDTFNSSRGGRIEPVENSLATERAVDMKEFTLQNVSIVQDESMDEIAQEERNSPRNSEPGIRRAEVTFSGFKIKEVIGPSSNPGK